MGEAAEFWEAHYGARPQVWSGNPNPVLVDDVADLAPGTALDLGCGEGGDAVWLARRGWRVTAVDVSQTALDRGARLADGEGVGERIEWQRHDLASSFPSGEFDLVSAQFLQSPLELPIEHILRSAADAVAAGGTLLVVSHAAPPPGASHDHHDHQGDDRHPAFPDPTATAEALGLTGDGWDLVSCGVRERDGVINARRR